MASGAVGEAAPPYNERQPKVAWNPAWAKFRPLQYITTGVLVAADVAIVLAVPDPNPRWDGALPFDTTVTSVLRGGTGEARRRAQVWSDRLHVTNFIFGLTEAPIAAAAHGDWESAWQLSMLNAQSYAVAGLIQLGSSRLVGRVRPAIQRCAEENSEEFPCKEGGATLSFISGHAMTSFVSAGLMCAHHGRLPLWGGGWRDIAACAAMITSATTTGFLRVMADKHYFSDVFIGSLLGFAIGYSLPMLGHYRKFNDVPTEAKTRWFYPLAPLPMIASDRVGASWSALF